jgi:hypothetical protein
MRLYLAATCLVICTTIAAAQTNSDYKKPGDSPPSGRTVLPDNTVSPDDKGQLQPQGWTGPLSTGTGGAPASSPQGDSPPAMQTTPGGTSNPSPTGR